MPRLLLVFLCLSVLLLFLVAAWRTERAAAAAEAAAAAAATAAAAAAVEALEPGPGPFVELSFDEALARARGEDRIVFIDFFTTWCQPCKLLDRTTWQDESVLGWLGERAVSIKLDAEQEPELAERFFVEAYPTLVFVAADGTMIDSIEGYRDGEKFLGDAIATLAGRTSLHRAREAFEKAPDDPMVRAGYGRELARKNRHAEALEHFLWCFDHGLEHSPSYVGVRLSFLMGDLTALAEEHPPARVALVERRDAAAAQVIATGNPQAGLDLNALNDALADRENGLQVYEELRAQDWGGRAARGVLLSDPEGVVFSALLDAGRYAEIVEDLEDMEERLAQSLEMLRMMRGMGDRFSESAEALQRARHIRHGACYYEVLLGAREDERAGQIAGRVFQFDESEGTFSALAERARRAKREDAVAGLRASWEKVTGGGR